MDTFCVGLCFFHLLSCSDYSNNNNSSNNNNIDVESGAPYEELFADVLCPPYLQQQLQLLWETEESDSAFHVIKEVIDSLADIDDDDDEQEQQQQEPKKVL
jgi:hypothetical protein